MINGSFKRTKGRESIVVEDDASLPEQFTVTKTTVNPDKKALLAHIKETGEIPDGVDLVCGEDSYKITTAGGGN